MLVCGGCSHYVCIILRGFIANILVSSSWLARFAIIPSVLIMIGPIVSRVIVSPSLRVLISISGFEDLLSSSGSSGGSERES